MFHVRVSPACGWGEGEGGVALSQEKILGVGAGGQVWTKISACRAILSVSKGVLAVSTRFGHFYNDFRVFEQFSLTWGPI